MPADPIVIKADAFVRRMLEESDAYPIETCAVLYKIFLLTAVGMLKRKGQPHAIIAKNLRDYADTLEATDD